MQIVDTEGWKLIMERGGKTRIKPAMGPYAQFAHDQALAQQRRDRESRRKKEK